MKIAFVDRSYVHQSSAIPGMPGPMDYPFVVTQDHLRANVSGIEMYRVPLFHELIDRGHEIKFLANRDVMPSAELDADLQRLKAVAPEFEPFVRDQDPMLDQEFWDVRSQMNLDIQDTYYEEKETKGSDSTAWFLPRFHARQWGEPPEADVVWLSTMRTNVASGLNQSYITGCYLDRGVPVILHDSNRQMSGTAALIQHMGYSWPHPLLTIASPYLEPTSWGPTEHIDFPYMARFEREPLRVRDKDGIVYVGNDYNRRDKMEKLLLRLPDAGIPVRVYGRFQNNRKDETKLSGYKGDVEAWTRQFEGVEWMGSIPNCHVPLVTEKALLTVNIVKLDYEKLGLATLRTFESPLYGTLQAADADIHAIGRYVPERYLVSSRRDVRRLYEKVRRMDDAEYQAELADQRNMVRGNDFDRYFYPRFVQILEDAVRRAERWKSDGSHKHDPDSEHLQPARRKT